VKQPRPLATVTVEEGQNGSTVVLRTDRGARVHYGPFAPEGVEAPIMHLGSALAMAAMRYQTVLRGADFGPALHQQGLPDETRAKREEIAVRLAETMAKDGISRELYADMLGYLGLPVGVGQPRLATLLTAIEGAFAAREGRTGGAQARKG
jgi:hypothetical protein